MQINIRSSKYRIGRGLPSNA